MPPKNIQFGPGTLYFENGEMVGEVQEANLTIEETDDLNSIEEPTTVKVLNGTGEATFTMNGRVSSLTLLSLIHGKKITNNWLKMHGGVMTRRWLK